MHRTKTLAVVFFFLILKIGMHKHCLNKYADALIWVMSLLTVWTGPVRRSSAMLVRRKAHQRIYSRRGLTALWTLGQGLDTDFILLPDCARYKIEFQSWSAYCSSACIEMCSSDQIVDRRKYHCAINEKKKANWMPNFQWVVAGNKLTAFGFWNTEALLLCMFNLMLDLCCTLQAACTRIACWMCARARVCFDMFMLLLCLHF